MLTYITSAILGLVQGVAEFLPISSSGHLSLAQNLLGVLDSAQQDLFFDLLLHLGTLIAVFVVYFRDIAELLRDFFGILCNLFTRSDKPRHETSSHARMVLLLIVATLPLVPILLVKGYVETLYSNTLFIGVALLVTGTLLFLSDRINRGRKTARNATLVDALLIGCGQAIAVVPGLSRSGTTISVGMMRGLDRKFAVRFSFLLSIPAILGANILSIGDAVKAGIDPKLIPIYLVGVLVAAVSGFFAIKLVNFLAQEGKFGRFSYYCWAVGLIAIVATLVISR